MLQGAGDELGEFIFIKMDLVVEGVPADKVKVQVNLKQGDGSQLKQLKDKSTTISSDNKKLLKEILPVPTL